MRIMLAVLRLKKMGKIMLVFSIYAKIHAVTIYKSLIWNGIFSLPRALISSNFELTKIIEAINK